MMSGSVMGDATRPLVEFSLFSKLPIEVRITIWKFAIPDRRIVHIRQRQLREPEEEDWWKRVRTDVPMWPCDKPFSQDELDPWKRDDWDDKFDCDYDGDNVFDDVGIIERLDKEGAAAKANHDKLWKLPDSMRCIKFKQMDNDHLEMVQRVRRGESREAVLHEMTRDGKAIPFYDGTDEEGLPLYDVAIQTTWSDDVELHLGWEDCSERPIKLWGFSTECDIPALLLVNKESNQIASRLYRPAFGALGAIPQVYIDFERDYLYIDHRTMTSKGYSYLSSTLRKCFLTLDLSQVTGVVVEGLVPYQHQLCGANANNRSSINQYQQSWLLDVSMEFPNVQNVVDMYRHWTYGPPRSREEELKYIDLKFVELNQQEETRPTIGHPNHRSVYFNGVRVHQSILDCDEFMNQNYWRTADNEFHERHKQWHVYNPKSVKKPADISCFTRKSVISEHDEMLLVRDAIAYEKAHINGD